MNQYGTIESSQGILKTDYKPGRSELDEALARRRKKLADDKIGERDESSSDGDDSR